MSPDTRKPRAATALGLTDPRRQAKLPMMPTVGSQSMQGHPPVPASIPLVAATSGQSRATGSADSSSGGKAAVPTSGGGVSSQHSRHCLEQDLHGTQVTGRKEAETVHLVSQYPKMQDLSVRPVGSLQLISRIALVVGHSV